MAMPGNANLSRLHPRIMPFHTQTRLGLNENAFGNGQYLRRQDPSLATGG